jgi:DNA-binding response OmpR family regulator
MNIAIVEDDPIQRATLESWLQEAGHDCFSYASAIDFSSKAQRHVYQVILLDWEMPGMSGIELLDSLRNHHKDTTPVIFITMRDNEGDIVRALQQGADDYLVKPARRQELLARIEARTRGTRHEDSGQRSIGSIQIDNLRQAISVDGSQVKLTQKEFSLACYLLDNRGRLISRKELLENVWGHSGDLNTRTLDTHISRIRKKLCLTPDRNWQLSAIYQHGYRLDHRVEGGTGQG